ncbi:LytTR family DNA-binding domain-containing protein [Enterococcus sp. LJL90]
MKVEIKHLSDQQQEESALLEIFELTANIETAVTLLQEDDFLFEAKNIETEAFVKLKFSQLVYAEYLERNIFLYTAEAGYSMRLSLSNFLKQLPQNFVQISKSVVVNLYGIQNFSATGSGNLIITVTTGEKLVVNRRYVRNLKELLHSQS